MNVYDFDNTVFIPDSSASFLLFCLRHYPRAVLKALPSAAVETVIYLAQGRKDAKWLKQALFSFLNGLDSAEAVVEEFWQCHADQMEAWYLKQLQPDDLIISASPEFLLRPMADRLGVSLIATRMDPCSGQIRGKNCHDEEKARRFLAVYPADSIDRFYSDSLSDSPMAALAREAFLVIDGEFCPWPGKESCVRLKTRCSFRKRDRQRK